MVSSDILHIKIFGECLYNTSIIRFVTSTWASRNYFLYSHLHAMDFLRRCSLHFSVSLSQSTYSTPLYEYAFRNIHKQLQTIIKVIRMPQPHR